MEHASVNPTSEGPDASIAPTRTNPDLTVTKVRLWIIPVSLCSDCGKAGPILGKLVVYYFIKL